METSTGKGEKAGESAAQAPAPGARTRRARLVRPGELWGRRSVAVGGLLVGLALIGGVLLLVFGSDGGDPGSESPAQISNLQDRFLKHTVVVPPKGISVRRPANWKDWKRNDAISLQSHDRCLAMSLSAPVAADEAGGLRKDSIALLHRSYDGATVRGAAASRIGGVPTTTNTVSFKDQQGDRIRILLSVGRGKKNAYLTEVVLRDPACQGDLAMGQLVLTSVQYTK